MGVSVVSLKKGASVWAEGHLLVESIVDFHTQSGIFTDVVNVVVFDGGFVAKGDGVELARILENDSEQVGSCVVFLF